MTNRPINKRLLIHTVEWKQSNFTNQSYIIKNVRIYENRMLFEQAQVQTVWSNFVLDWDSTYSTPLPEGKMFAIGDTILWDGYPRIMQITAIRPHYATDGKTVQHLQINLK